LLSAADVTVSHLEKPMYERGLRSPRCE
jgi:hypothetical protein